jgi:hypothetical protein
MNVGSTSPAQNVVLSNTGDASLSIAGVGIESGDWTEFNETNNCGSSVVAGANCTFTVTFSPNTTGPVHSAITIDDNGATGGQVIGAQTISLNGTGAPQATQPGNYQVWASASYGSDVHNLAVSVNLQ